MNACLDLPPEHLDLVREVLRRHLPSGCQVWAFGSRARGGANRFSDLDLAIDAGEALDRDKLLDLQEDFEESPLPYKVDLVDWQTAIAELRASLGRTRVVLTF